MFIGFESSAFHDGFLRIVANHPKKVQEQTDLMNCISLIFHRNTEVNSGFVLPAVGNKVLSFVLNSISAFKNRMRLSCILAAYLFTSHLRMLVFSIPAHSDSHQPR